MGALASHCFASSSSPARNGFTSAISYRKFDRHHTPRRIIRAARGGLGPPERCGSIDEGDERAYPQPGVSTGSEARHDFLRSWFLDSGGEQNGTPGYRRAPALIQIARLR